MHRTELLAVSVLQRCARLIASVWRHCSARASTQALAVAPGTALELHGTKAALSCRYPSAAPDATGVFAMGA